MNHRIEKLFFALAIAVLLTGLFLLGQTGPAETKNLRAEMQVQLKTAFIQSIGDGPWFSDLALIYDGVDDFYRSAATSMIALFSPSQNDTDLILLAGNVKTRLSQGLDRLHKLWSGEYVSIASNFMTEEPIYNIIPDYGNSSETAVSDQELNMIVFDLLKKAVNSPLDQQLIVPGSDLGSVAGVSLYQEDLRPANNRARPWITVQDNITGQLYCLAIYDSEINKYLGYCKND